MKTVASQVWECLAACATTTTDRCTSRRCTASCRGSFVRTYIHMYIHVCVLFRKIGWWLVAPSSCVGIDWVVVYS